MSQPQNPAVPYHANPYTGQPLAQPGYGPTGQPGMVARGNTNTLAIVSLITGIVLIILLPLVPLVCGSISMKQIGRTGESGKWMAVTGLVLGILGSLFWVTFWILIIANGGEFHYSASTG